jgi:hypothetical protein
LRGVLLQWNDPKHTRNHRFRLIGNQDLSMFFNALQVYGRKLVRESNALASLRLSVQADFVGLSVADQMREAFKGMVGF